MKKEQILEAIKNLAKSCGFYQRTYEALSSGTEQSEKMLSHLVARNFKDAVDLVLYIECGF